MAGFTNNTLPNSFELEDHSIVEKISRNLEYVEQSWTALAIGLDRELSYCTLYSKQSQIMQIVVSSSSVVAKVQSLDSFVITYALPVVLIIEPNIVFMVQFYRDICRFLVTILAYKPWHVQFIYRCPVKKSDHVTPG